MDLIVATLWPTLLLAGAAGLVFSSVGGPGRGAPSSLRAVQLGATTFLVAGLVLAFLRVVPGRAGLWLEIGVLVCASYAAGAAIGSVAHARWRGRRPAKPVPAPIVQPSSGESGSPS